MRAAAALNKSHPAMAACVAKYPRSLIVPTNSAQRPTEADTFDMVAGVRDRRRRNEHAGKRAQQSQFIRESAWVDIVLNWFSPNLTFIGSTRVDMGQYAAHGLHIVGDRRLCRRAHRAPPLIRSHNQAS